MPPDTGFTLSELSALSDAPARTIRYYIAQGLLPAPGRDGPSTRYDEAFLARLRLIKQLRLAHLPLAEIRKRLEALTDEEAIELAEAPAPKPPDGALDYVRALLRESGPTRAAVPPPGPGAPVAAPAWLRLSDQVSGQDLLAEMQPPPGMLLRRIESMPPQPSPVHTQAARAPQLRTQPAQAPSSRAATPERSQWERIVLEPDVELHVRRPLTRLQNKRLERLIAFARELQEGDKP
jgi:DNA-binding transcriptional MerR regulator